MALVDKPEKPEVLLIHNGGGLARTVYAALRTRFDAAAVKLGDEAAKAPNGALACVVSLSALTSANSPLVRQLVALCDTPPIFLFQSFNDAYVERANAFGASQIQFAPVDAPTLTANVAVQVSRAVEASWGALPPAQAAALRQSISGFTDCFRAAATGEPLPVESLSSACSAIEQSLGVSSIEDWLGALRNHHDRTYVHSMYVCGALSHFAYGVGVRGGDLERLVLGGFVHDVGKSRVPLEILDKPGKLDELEWEAMRAHPKYSEELLLAENGFEQGVVSMAVNHHEKIDGSGYPKGLKDGQIDDLVRLTTIADVFAALTEPRAYKGGMTTEKAVGVMNGMSGHFDQNLLRAFSEFMLDHKRAAA